MMGPISQLNFSPLGWTWLCVTLTKANQQSNEVFPRSSAVSGLEYIVWCSLRHYSATINHLFGIVAKSRWRDFFCGIVSDCSGGNTQIVPEKLEWLIFRKRSSIPITIGTTALGRNSSSNSFLSYLHLISCGICNLLISLCCLASNPQGYSSLYLSSIEIIDKLHHADR